jgi:tetrapyrrole methylase family protein / MazG family protein
LSSTITIAGLGYGDPGARSVAVQQALDGASRIVLRTAIHEGIDDLIDDPRVVACDDLYESLDAFELVYQGVIDRVLDFADSGDVVFAVPGSPSFGEDTCRDLSSAATRRGHQVRVISSPSGLDAVAQLTGIDLLSSQARVLDATWVSEQVASEPFSGGAISIDPTMPLIIGQIFSRNLASDVKHWLSRLYAGDHLVSIVSNAGIPDKSSIDVVPLSELDHHEMDHLTTVVVMPLDRLDAQASPATLHRIIADLRSDDGCPWDRKQTHESLKDKVIEEAHEVAEAIDHDDPDELAGELGDLLLLVALHAQIAEEEGTFAIEDVYRQVNAKLVRRHPHVFGDAVAETPEDVLTTWRGVKAQEKLASGELTDPHRFDQLPSSMSVIQRIKRSESFEERPAGAATTQIGNELLEVVKRSLDAGVDPEPALERAYRNSIANEMSDEF